MDISIVIPVFNEYESLPELEAWLQRIMKKEQFQYEMIFIDDGSTDGSWKIIEDLSKANTNIKGIRFKRNYGKSAALNEGFKLTTGNVVVTMDADLQDNPDEIPELYKMITEQDFDLVSCWKEKRNDPLSKTIPSKFFNYVTRKISKIQLRDFNCGLKAYKIDVVKSIELYSEMHRYIPILAKWAGYSKIGEKSVIHFERKFGVTKFGMERYIKGFLDLVTIFFIGKFGKRPMHLFGTVGVLSFFFGFIILIYLTIAKLIWKEYGITERPLFYLGIVTLIIGTQLFVTGFISELIVRNSANKSKYVIDKKIL